MLTLSFDSQLCSLSNVGGKGYNLSILSRACSGDEKYSVPTGFVITTSVYDEFVRHDNGRLLKEIESALTLSKQQFDNDGNNANSDAVTDLEEISTTIRSAFRKHRLSKVSQTEIDERLSSITNNTQQNQCYYAVRSSATCEDMPDASFAGQHDTFLNIPSSDINKHIIECFSSLYTSRAISYRQRNNISHIDANMAVVVQLMAPKQVSSGVLFTANPLTGRRNESVLEAIPGLGEALVSGLTEPDRYVVSVKNMKDSHDNDDGTIVSIKDKRVGAKKRTITAADGGGVMDTLITSVEADSSHSNTVLTDVEVKRLIQVGQNIQDLFGKPQDIEWTMSEDSSISIVQSRPITTLFPMPKNVPMEPLQVFFSFNAVQGIVAPIYPAGQDALRTGFLGGIIKWITWNRHGQEGTFMKSPAERLYINITNPLRNKFGRIFLCNVLLPVAEPGSMIPLKELLDEPDLSMKKNSGISFMSICNVLRIASKVIPRLIFSILFPNWSRRRLIRRVDDLVNSIGRKVSAVNDLHDLVALECETFPGLFPILVPHLAPRIAAGLAMPLALLGKLASSLDDGNDLVLTITRGLPHNVTTEMDLKLWQVAKTIQGDVLSLNHFNSNNEADALADDYLQGKLPPVAQNAVSEFMNEYGMRGLYEIDFGRPRWREAPAPLMSSIKSYLQISEDNAPDRVFKRGELASVNAIQQLGKQLGKPWLVSFLAKRIRCLAGIRELPKFTIIRVMGHFLCMLEEGEKLVEAGVIDTATDLFYLYLDELESLAKGQLKNCKEIICERKATMEVESKRTHLPHLIASDGYAYFGGSVSSSLNTKEGSNMLCGEPVSPGVYEGRIRIIHDPSKSKQLSHGDILCCHGTDPSWTPLFLSAGALVMEVGGLMTHGSVVAREYGIPAVVGLEKVTERLMTGQLVRIDGSSGTVEILD